MSIVTKSFTATGVSTSILVPSGSLLKILTTGTFVGTVVTEQSRNGGLSWDPIQTNTGTVDTEVRIEDPARQDVLVRNRCSAFTSGTIVTTLTNENVDGYGLVAAGADTVEEKIGKIRTTKLTLTAKSITLTDDAGVGQLGSLKLYDFPEGRIVVLGAIIAADLTLVGAPWLDTAEGDVALGTAAIAGGGAMAGTEMDILTSTAVAAMVAQVGPINAAGPGTPVLLDGSSTPKDVYLNVRIDDNAAHVTATGTITGDVTLVWVNLDEVLP